MRKNSVANAALLVALPFCSTALPATDTNLTEALAQVQKNASKRKEFSLTFQQTLYSAFLNNTKQEKGTLEYKAPRSFRWEVKGSKGDLIVSNGKDSWRYNAVSNHAQRLPQNLSDFKFLDVLFNPGQLSQNYKVAEWQPSAAAKNSSDEISDYRPTNQENKVFVTLTPKELSKEKITYVVLNKTIGLVDEIRIFYNDGRKTRIVFDSFSEKPVSLSRFEFIPPPGTAVNK